MPRAGLARAAGINLQKMRRLTLMAAVTDRRYRGEADFLGLEKRARNVLNNSGRRVYKTGELDHL